MSPTAGVSVSTIAATATATECHMLKIDGLKRLRIMHPTGARLESCAFEAAGHTWRIRCYPDGAHGHAGFISLYLVLDDAAADAVAGDMHVEVKFSMDEMCKRHHSGAARGVMWFWEAFVKFFLGCFQVYENSP
ncbi:hypothetical protein EJB05_52357, partial [Eragrostis curvula]